MTCETNNEIENICRALESTIKQCDKLGLDIVAARASEALDAADHARDMIVRGFLTNTNLRG